MLEVSKTIYNFLLYIKNKFMSKKQSKKDPSYMLFLFGDFYEQEKLTTNLSSQLLTVVSSPFLKFTYGDYGVVFHFKSKEHFYDLKEYIDMCMSEITEQYFLIELTNNIDIKMPTKLKKDFLNIDGKKNIKNKIVEINVEKKLKDQKEEVKNFTFEFFLPSDFNTNIKTEPEYPPTVDEILDKISDKGIDSLTDQEKNILDNYGKRKN